MNVYSEACRVTKHTAVLHIYIAYINLLQGVVGSSALVTDFRRDRISANARLPVCQAIPEQPARVLRDSRQYT